MRAEESQRTQNLALQSALDDCAARFVMGLSAEELEDKDRIYYHIQEAHWFYRDLLCEQTPELPRMSLGNFGYSLLCSCELFRLLYPTDGEKAALYERWREFAKKVPLMGCILLDGALSKVLLVHQKGHWMFPKTKVHDGEAWPAGAVRAVRDDLGLDVSSAVASDTSFVDFADPESHTFARFYIAAGVEDALPGDSERTAEWFLLKELPGWHGAKGRAGVNFYTVESVVPDLRRWVEAPTRPPERRVQPKAGPARTEARGPETTPEAEETEEKPEVVKAPGGLANGLHQKVELSDAPTDRKGGPAAVFRVDVAKVIDRVRFPWTKVVPFTSTQ